MLAALKPKTEAPPALERIEAEVREAEADLARLREEHGATALAALEGETGAEQRRQAARKALEDAEQRLWDAQAAREAARAREKQEAEQQEAERRRKAWAEVRKHTKARAAAAKRMDEAINEFVTAYEELAEHTAALMDACPVKGVSRHAHPAGWSRTDGAIRHFLRSRGVPWACELHATMPAARVRQYVIDANDQLLALEKDDR